MANIVITNHAIMRCIERNIDVHQVKKIVKKGSVVKRNLDGTMVLKGKADSGKEMEVVCIERNNKIIIKTAYYAG